MRWYLAVRYFCDAYTEYVISDDSVRSTVSYDRQESPGTIENNKIVPYVPPGIVCHCYDETSNTVLVGFTAQSSGMPATDWQSLTVQEAAIHYESYEGRAPSSAEVF